MQRYFLIHLLAFLFLVFSPRLYTEEIDLQQLLELSVSDLTDIYISVASKREELIHAAPGVITVLSADQLQQYGVRNLFDVLDMIPNTLGLSSAVMRDNLSSTRAQQAVAQDRHTLILINGRPFVDAFYGGRSQPLYTSFPISEVKQIEVVRGPGSVLYGSNAMSTIINIVTKDTASDSEIALTAGSFNTFTLEASHSGHYLNSENHLGLYINDSEGWEYAAVDASNTFHEENYGYQNKGAWLEINRQKFSLALFHVWLKSERLGARPLWPSEVTHLHRLFLDIGYQQYINDWEINSHVTINETDGKLPTVDDRHVTVELDAKRSFLERMNLYFKLSHILLEADDRVSNPHQNNIDSYSNTFAMQLDYQFTDPYKLVIGVQANDPEMTELDYSGRVGIIGAYDSGWGWKLLYGEAFRSPYLLELFAQIQYVAIGNPNLEPEEIYSWDWQIFYRQEKSFYSVTLYKSDQENTIYIDPSTRIFQNVTSLEFSGIEIEWQQIVLPRLVFEGSISVQQNENESGVKDLQLVPNEMAKFGVRYTSLTGASIGIFDVYTNAPTAREKLFPTTLIVNSEPKAIHDLSISVKMPIKHAALSSAKAESFLQFNAENILESEAITFPDLVFPTVNALPFRSGRAFYLKLNSHF